MTITPAEDRARVVVNRLGLRHIDRLDALAAAFERATPHDLTLQYRDIDDGNVSFPFVDDLPAGDGEAKPDRRWDFGEVLAKSDRRWDAAAVLEAARETHVSPRAILNLVGAIRRHGLTSEHVVRLLMAAPTDAEARTWVRTPPTDENLDLLLSLAGHRVAARPDTRVAP